MAAGAQPYTSVVVLVDAGAGVAGGNQHSLMGAFTGETVGDGVVACAA